MVPSPTPLALLLAGAAVVAFGLVLLYAGGPPWATALAPDGLHYALLRCGAKANGLIAGGEVWRLLSAVFLHGNLLHLLLNVVGLLVLATIAERLLGRRRAFLLFVLSGLGASVASFLVSPALSVGASGATYGLLGAIVVLLARERHQLPPERRRVLLVAPAAWLALSVGLGFLIPGVDRAAHIGGLLVGGVLGLVLRSSLSPPGRRGRERAVDAVTLGAAAALVVSLCLAAFAALHPLSPVRLEVVPHAPSGGRPVPAGWRPGRMVDGRCVSPSRDAERADAPWCFVDDYEALLVMGEAGWLFAGQPDVIARLRAASGPEPPVEEVGEREALFVFPVGGGVTYVLACYPQLADHYRPLATALFGAVQRGTGGGIAPSSP